MKCKYCGGIHTIKKGKRGAIQRYYCKDCSKYFQGNYFYKAYLPDINKWISKLLKNGCGIEDIARILEISSKTVLS